MIKKEKERGKEISHGTGRKWMRAKVKKRKTNLCLIFPFLLSIYTLSCGSVRLKRREQLAGCLSNVIQNSRGFWDVLGQSLRSLCSLQSNSVTSERQRFFGLKPLRFEKEVEGGETQRPCISWPRLSPQYDIIKLTGSNVWFST